MRSTLVAAICALLTCACVRPYAPDEAPRLELNDSASIEERLSSLRASYRSRIHRIDWKSDSVVKRIGWALDRAQVALRKGERLEAEAELRSARRLLELY